LKKNAAHFSLRARARTLSVAHAVTTTTGICVVRASADS
jgi:hypothetical protein